MIIQSLLHSGNKNRDFLEKASDFLIRPFQNIWLNRTVQIIEKNQVFNIRVIENPKKYSRPLLFVARLFTSIPLAIAILLKRIDISLNHSSYKYHDIISKALEAKQKGYLDLEPFKYLIDSNTDINKRYGNVEAQTQNQEFCWKNVKFKKKEIKGHDSKNSSIVLSEQALIERIKGIFAEYSKTIELLENELKQLSDSKKGQTSQNLKTTPKTPDQPRPNNSKEDPLQPPKPTQDNKETPKTVKVRKPLNLTPNDAAILIQKNFRKYLVLKPLLSPKLFFQYRVAIDKVNKDANSMQKAINGATPVYLPQDLQVVLKQSSFKSQSVALEKTNDLKINHPREQFKQAYKRFDDMQRVREILNELKIECLIIPKARLCENFIVEERLPISPTDFHNMDLYVSQHQLFDQAVLELTRLFSKINIGDLVNDLNTSKNIIGTIRYDNLPLYIIENKGFLGLIDLGQFKMEMNPKNIVNLVFMFPYHLELIKNEALRLQIPIDDEVLTKAANMGLQYLTDNWKNYAAWLEKKKISLDNPPFEISSKSKQQLISIIEKELKERGDKKMDPNIPAQALAQEIVPMVIQSIKSEIQKSLIKKFGKMPTQTLKKPDLAFARKLKLNSFFELYKGARELLEKKTKLDIWDAMHCTKLICKKLEEMDEVFLFQTGGTYSTICY